LWQHVFQAVVFVLSAVQRASRTLHGTQYKHHSLKHILPQYNTAEDGPGGPKHVGANV